MVVELEIILDSYLCTYGQSEGRGVRVMRNIMINIINEIMIYFQNGKNVDKLTASKQQFDKVSRQCLFIHFRFVDFCIYIS